MFVHNSRTFGENLFNGPFYVNHAGVVRTHIMERGHVLMQGFKGNDVKAGELSADRIDFKAGLCRSGQQGPFGWISLDLPAVFPFNQQAVVT